MRRLRAPATLALIALVVTSCASAPSETPAERHERVRTFIEVVHGVEWGDNAEAFAGTWDGLADDAIKYCAEPAAVESYAQGLAQSGEWAAEMFRGAAEVACAPDFGY